MTDWISLTEACYDLARSPTEWLEQLIDRATPLLDLGDGATALVFRLSATHFAVDDVAVRGSAELEAFARGSNLEAPPEAIDLVYRSGTPAATLSDVVFSRLPPAAEIFAASTNGTFRDAFGIVAHTGTGAGVALTAPTREIRSMTRVERRRWTRVAAHVGAGLRLRLWSSNLDLDDGAVEAIMDAEGRVQDARGAALGSATLDRLRAAVVQVERARGSLRRGEPDRAQALWEGLVRGRWSLVDVFDSDGRRYVAAVRNDPRMGDPRGLSERELQVTEFLGLGRSVKEIAYLLGLAPSTVASVLDRVRYKLGLGSKAEIAAFFAPNGLRARLTEVPWEGESLLVASAPLLDEAKMDLLSDSERIVAEMLLKGSTTAAIAAAREVTERTVANQVQSIYRKLDVRSRTELALAMAAPAPHR